MQETPRLLFVHAHPDDESITNGVTIAHYVGRGAQVQVVNSGYYNYLGEASPS